MEKMRKYKKRPLVISAFQWEGEIHGELVRDPRVRVVLEKDGTKSIEIDTIDHASCRAYIGDFVIRGTEGELYPCKKEIFEAIYEDL
jgi:hypothetical protein